MSNELAKNNYSRVFLFKNGIYANESGSYVTAMAVDSLAQDRGDVTPIQEPSDENYGQFVEIDQIPGELSRMTTTLTGRMSRTEVSTFYDLFKKACAFDLHLHFGLCQKPTDFVKYDKALIFENVFVTSFGTDPLVALASGDVAVIQETLDISIGNFFEVVPLKYTIKGSNETVDGAIVDVTISDSASCGGDCEDSSTGWNKIFTASDDYKAYVSGDGGLNWTAFDVAASPPVGETIVGGTVIGNYYVLVDTAGTLWYAEKKGLLDGDVTNFASVTTSITDPLEISAYRNDGYIAAANGVVWKVTESLSPEIVDNGSSTTEDLQGVHSTKDVTVAVGTAGAVIYSYDGELWFEATAPASISLVSVAVKSKTNWLVGSANGQVWVTVDSGKTWSRVKYPSYTSITDSVREIVAVNGHVVYMTIGTKFYRSIDGGVTWTVQPDSTATFQTNTALHAIGATALNTNFVVVGGIASGAGLLVLGVA